MNERLLIGLLTAVNFTHLVDFVIMMPLGPQLMTVFGISAREFAVAVSAYTFSAAIAAVVGALFIDRYERKRALLVLYAGFTLATLACALAPTFAALVAARIAAGAFGGMLGAVILAIVADRIPYERRGAAMGVVMSAFSLASVLGVPAGVWLAAWLDWHAAFVAIAVVASAIFAIAAIVLEPMRGHLAAHRSPREVLVALVREPHHWWAFSLSAALVFAGFLVIPFIAVFLSRNIGLGAGDLGLVYLCGGLCTVVTSRLFGRMADRLGKRRVFTILAVLSIAPTLLLTHLPPVPVAMALICSTAFIIFGSGRFVPATALVSGVVAAPLRGGFMSLNAAVQSAASGTAAIVAGLIIAQDGGQAPLRHYDVAGWASVAMTLVCILLAGRVGAAAVAKDGMADAAVQETGRPPAA